MAKEKLEETNLVQDRTHDLALFQAMVENVVDGIVLSTLEGIITYANPADYVLFGYNLETREMVGLPLSWFFSESSLKVLVEEAIPQSLDGANWQGEVRGIRKDGTQFDLFTTVFAIRDERGDPIALTAVLRDLTEQKQTEEALQQREAVLGSIALAAEKFLRSSDWEQDMQAVLAYLGKAADVSRVLIWEGSTSEDGKYLISWRYEWIAPEAKLAPLQGQQKVPVFRRWRGLLPRGEIITGHVRDFSATEQEFFVPRGIKSILVVPIFVNDTWWGFMGFDQGGTEREWTEAEIDTLKTAASILGGALERKWAEEMLGRRTTQLQVAAEVSRATSSILEPDELIQQMVNLVREQFDLYYAGLFLMDQTGEWTSEPGKWAVLRAGTGEAGRKMVEQGHKLEVGGESMIGWCVANKQARIAQDVGEEAVRFDNPLLPETHSEMALPLISRGQVIGAMTIQSTRPAAFSDEDVTVLQTMADQLANAIENARLFEETLARTRDVTALVETGGKLVSTLELDAVLDSLMDACLELFRVQQACFIMMDEDGYLRMRRHRGFSEEFVRSIVGRPGEGFYGKVYQSGEAILVKDAREQLNPVTAEAVLREGLMSFVHVPVKVKGETVAVMNLTSLQEDRRFSERDLEKLSAFADQAAIAIENARLFEEAQERAEELAALNTIASTVSRSLEIQDILQEALSEVIRVMGFEAGLVGLTDEMTGQLVLSFQSGLPGPLVSRLEEAGMGDTLCNFVFQTSEGLGLSDLRDGAPVNVSELLRHGIRSYLGAPLMHKGQSLGTICIFSYSPQPLTAANLSLMAAIGQQVGVAVHNARLFEETQYRAVQLRVVNEVSRTLTSILDVDTLLDHVVRLIRDTFDYYQVNLGLIEGDALVPKAWAGALNTFPAEVARLNLDAEAIVTKVVTSGTPLLVPDVHREPSYFPLPGLEEVRSELVVPLKYKDQAIGVLDVESDRLAAFDERDLIVLEALAGQIAVAIENARLFEAEAQRRREAETLRQTATALTSTLDLQKALDLILEQLRRVVAYDSASVQLLRDNHLEIVGGRGFADPSAVIGLCFPVPGDNPNTRVIEGGEPVILANAQAAHAPFREPPHDHIRSWLGVPMRFRERTIGMITLDSTESGYFTADHARLAAAFASQATVAVENARLFEQTQAALAEVRRLATIVENHPDFIGVGTLDGQALYVNPAGLKMMGLPSDHDVTTMEARDFYPAEDAQKLVKEGIPAALEEGSWSAEATLLKADGTTIPVGQTIGINYDADGKPYSFSITMRDISERKAAAEALRVSEERFALAVRGTNDGLWDWDIQNDSLYWSPRLKELVGYADDELDVDFDTFNSFLHPDDEESTGAAIEAHLKDRGLYDVEQRLRTKSGEYRWFHVRGQAIWDEVGQPLRMVGSATDITERKQAEAERERLFTEMENLTRELAVLNEMGRALTMMLDVDAVIEHLYQHASRLIDTTNFYVALYYPDQDEVDFPFYAEGDQIRRPGRRRSGKGMTEYVIQTREPLLIKENIAARSEELGIELIGQEAQSWLGVPMMRGEQVIGVIAVQSYTTPWLYNEHHRDLLSAIANQAAIAIENARLFEQAQARARREQILREITTRVRGSTDPDTIVRAAVRELGTALGRPTFVRLGSAEQLSPIPQVQADDGKGSAQKGQHPEPVEGGE